MTFREMFEEELESRGIRWCRSCDSRQSHKRGFAGSGVVHYDSQIGTRATLMGGLHEIGHIVLGHKGRARRRYIMEAEATAWAVTRMRELGVPVPRKEMALYRDYVVRMKRWGDNVAAGRS